MIMTTLMQDEFGCAALAVGYESDLRIHNLRKVIAVALWKHLYFRLASRLRKEVIAFHGNPHYEIRSKLVAAAENVRRHLDRSTFRRLVVRPAVLARDGGQYLHHQWTASIGVGHHNHTPPRVRICDEHTLEAVVRPVVAE